MIWPFTRGEVIVTTASQSMILVSVAGEVTFDWAAIRAYLERPLGDTFEPSLRIAQIALAAYNEGMAAMGYEQESA